MVNKTLVVFLGLDVLYLICACIHLGLPLFARLSKSKPPALDTVAVDLLLSGCPLTASIINSICMFIAFAISLPALCLKSNRNFLIAFGCAITFTAFFTLVIGLEIWFSTLQTQTNLAPIWTQQSTFIQSMLQFKFQCCGYDKSQLFVQDKVCTNATTAAHLGTCNGPFGVFANQFLDIIFTMFFGICAVDAMLFLALLCVLKERTEMARYKFIEEKRMYGSIQNF